MDYIFCLIVLSIAVFLLYIKNYIRCVYLAFNLKGPPVVPLFGNVLLINKIKEIIHIGTNAHQMYGSLFRCWISIVPFFWIYEPRHLKIILAGKNTKKNIFYKVLHNFIGKGLITNNGDKWKTHRKLIQPYFHVSILEKYITIFSENSALILKNLEGQSDVKITPFINNCVLKILHKAVLGISLESGTEESPYRKGEVILLQRISRPWLLLETVFKYSLFAKNEMKQKLNLHEYTKDILLKRRDEKTKSAFRSLLDIFIEISDNNADFSDEDIINEAVTFMLAGQDSVGAAVAFSLYFIAKHQDVQRKIMTELDDIYENNSKITMTDLNNMKYLEQCIKESLRLVPSVPIISRVLTEEVILDGYKLPSGTNIFMSPFITHRLQHHFPDPLKFDPDRFSPENVEKLHPFAFIPFSMGHRNCIGYKFALLEIKIMLATILRHYHISLSPGHEELEFSYRATLRAKGGIWLRISPRHSIQSE